MSVEFTHVPTTGRQHLPQYLSPAFSDLPTRLSIEGTFRNVVIDGPAGILTNMDVAAETAEATATVGIVLTHWSGVMHPSVAAEQIAGLDRLADGRLSLRFLLGPDGQIADEAEHVEALRQCDEYLVLLKRLWSNDRPFDHEGPHFSLGQGYVMRKGPQGAEIPIRMGGVSGVAIDVAGRHATVFELAAGTPDEVRDLMARVDAAAARYGRAGRIAFALPVLFADVGEPHGVGSALHVSGPAARIAQTLLGYASLGIGEFMVSGLDDHDAIAAFADEVAPFFHRTVPIGTARRNSGLSKPARSRSWAS